MFLILLSIWDFKTFYIQLWNLQKISKSKNSYLFLINELLVFATFKSFYLFFIYTVIFIQSYWRVGCVHNASSHLHMLACRQWHPTPVLLPGISHGQRSLVGYSPWVHKELDTTEALHFTLLAWEISAIYILWHVLSLGLEWKLTFFSPVTTAEFSNFADIECSALTHFTTQYRC